MKTLLDVMNRKEVTTTKVNYVYNGVVQFTFLKLRYRDGKNQFPVMMRRRIERHKCEPHDWDYFVDLADADVEINKFHFSNEVEINLKNHVNAYRDAYLNDQLEEYMRGTSMHSLIDSKLIQMVFGDSLNNRDTAYLVEANTNSFKLDTYVKGKREVVTFNTPLTREALWNYVVDGSRVVVCHELKHREKIVSNYENAVKKTNPNDKLKAMRSAKDQIALILANEKDLKNDLKSIKEIIAKLGDLT